MKTFWWKIGTKKFQDTKSKTGNIYRQLNIAVVRIVHVQGLKADVAEQTRTMTIYSVVLVIVTLTCLTLSLWYATKLGDMLGKMAKHARKLQVKSSELSSEKRRADTLLCQMLPKEVAEQLKMNREVKAEHSDVKVKDGEVKAEEYEINERVI